MWVSCACVCVCVHHHHLLAPSLSSSLSFVNPLCPHFCSHCSFPRLCSMSHTLISCWLIIRRCSEVFMTWPRWQTKCWAAAGQAVVHPGKVVKCLSNGWSTLEQSFGLTSSKRANWAAALWEIFFIVILEKLLFFFCNLTSTQVKTTVVWVLVCPAVWSEHAIIYIWNSLAYIALIYIKSGQKGRNSKWKSLHPFAFSYTIDGNGVFISAADLRSYSAVKGRVHSAQCAVVYVKPSLLSEASFWNEGQWEMLKCT